MVTLWFSGNISAEATTQFGNILPEAMRGLSRWVSRIAAPRHHNVAAVALANKTTRIAWAMMKNGTEYEPDRAAA